MHDPQRCRNSVNTCGDGDCDAGLEKVIKNNEQLRNNMQMIKHDEKYKNGDGEC